MIETSKMNTLASLRLSGFLLSLAMVAGVSAILLYRKVVPWPFHGAATVAETWRRILVYLPVFIFSLASVWWMDNKAKPIRHHFRWNGFSSSFFSGLAGSLGYTLYLYLSCDFALKGAGFAVPATVLCLLNAVSEETLFRLILFQLLISRIGSWKQANLIQAMVYGIPHFFIGGPMFFLYAAGYGLVLGWITRTNQSLLPAIICHFIVDIGAVGLPLLVLI